MSDLPSFSDDIKEFIALLNRYGVKFLIVGGTAVIFYGYPRYTGDVDFFYEGSFENTEKLWRAIQHFWAGDIPGGLSLEELRVEGQIIQFGVPPHRIDLLNRIDGVSFTEAWEGRQKELLSWRGNVLEVPLIGLNELRKNKAASGRSKDLDDLGHLG